MHIVTLAQNASYACWLQPKVHHKRSYLRIVVQGRFCYRNTRLLGTAAACVAQARPPRMWAHHRDEVQAVNSVIHGVEEQDSKALVERLAGEEDGLGLRWHSQEAPAAVKEAGCPRCLCQLENHVLAAVWLRWGVIHNAFIPLVCINTTTVTISDCPAKDSHRGLRD